MIEGGWGYFLWVFFVFVGASGAGVEECDGDWGIASAAIGGGSGVVAAVVVVGACSMTSGASIGMGAGNVGGGTSMSGGKGGGAVVGGGVGGNSAVGCLVPSSSGGGWQSAQGHIMPWQCSWHRETPKQLEHNSTKHSGQLAYKSS